MAGQTVKLGEIRVLLAGDGHEPLSEMAISQFVKDGMPKTGRGAYNAIACMTWYLGRLRSSVQQRKTETEDGKMLSLDDAQIRLTTAKAENEEMTAKERRGELMPLSLHISETAKLITVVKQKFLNLPSRIAPRLEGLTNVERKALLQGAVKGALADLAKGDADGRDSAKPVAGPARKRTRARTPRKPSARK